MISSRVLGDKYYSVSVNHAEIKTAVAGLCVSMPGKLNITKQH